MGDGHRHGRLPDPSCAGQGHVPVLSEQIGDFDDVGFASDDAARQWRVGMGERIGQRRLLLDLADAGLDIGDEFVPAPRHGRDVDGLHLGVSQRAPQAPHIDLKIAVVEERARPGCRHQLVLGD
ncbi:hypothetical protein [Bradyrhizobium tunisiense]|uniref:hypothetical protein n=1 Tax=Bradyrhizobium tunisiense TaxID=3278709 RepID=UPI0035DA1A5E